MVSSWTLSWYQRAVIARERALISHLKRLAFLLPQDDPSEPRAPFGRFEAGLLVVIALGLTLMQFAGAELMFLKLFGAALTPEGAEISDWRYGGGPRSHPYYELFALLHWVSCCVLGYGVLPAVYLKLCGRKLKDFYLGFGGFARHAHIYLLLYLAVILPVVAVSFSPEYQRIYPFYVQSRRSVFDLVAWELAYGVQFFALEFFFRGVMLEGLKRWLGVGAVYVMIVPYCMLHFPKTLSESLGAIIAGVILGGMAMRFRSIWGGVLLHWAVAISMDVLSLLQQGELPTRLFR